MPIEFIKKIFSTKYNDVPDKNIHSKTDYDGTYTYAMIATRGSGIRINKTDSSFARGCWNVFYWFLTLNLLSGIVLNSMSLVKAFMDMTIRDITKIFRILPCIGYIILAFLKTYKMVTQRSVFENLINELRDMWPEGSVPQQDHVILSRSLKEINFIVKVYFICNYSLALTSLVPSYIEVIKRAAGQDIPRILPYEYWTPFDGTKPGFYEVTLTIEAWHTQVTILLIICGDLLFCILLNHITTQFELLSNRIRRLVYVTVDQQLIQDYPLGIYNKETVKAEVNTGQLLDSDKEKASETEMSHIIIRHKALIRLANDVEELFSFSLFCNFLYSSLIICFCGFCCVRIEKWNEFMYKSFLTTALSQIWILCWFGQRLLDSSTGISDALYESGWYRTTKKIKTSILIMMHRSHKQVQVTTYGFSVICLASFTTIVKTAWSYFTLLLNSFELN